MAGVTVLVLLLLIPLGMIHSVLRSDGSGVMTRGRHHRRLGQGQSVIGRSSLFPTVIRSSRGRSRPPRRTAEKVEVIETAIANAYFLRRR